MQSKLCYFDNQQKQKIFYFNRKSPRRDLKAIKESYFFSNSTPGIEPRAENFIAHEMSSSSKSREKFFTSSENQFRILFLSFNFTSRLLMVVVLAIQALNQQPGLLNSRQNSKHKRALRCYRTILRSTSAGIFKLKLTNINELLVKIVSFSVLSCFHLFKDQQRKSRESRGEPTGKKRRSVVSCMNNSAFFRSSRCLIFFLSSPNGRFRVFSVRLRKRMTTIVKELYEAINNVLRNQGKVARWKYLFLPCGS